MHERSTRNNGRERNRLTPLFSSLLDVVFYEFFGILFQHIVDFIDELVDIFFELLAGLDDFGIRLNVILALGLTFRFLFALLFFHSSTSPDQGLLSDSLTDTAAQGHLTPRHQNPSRQGQKRDAPLG